MAREIRDNEGNLVHVPHENHIKDLLFGENAGQHWFWLSLIAGGSQLLVGVLIFFTTSEDLQLAFWLMFIGGLIVTFTIGIYATRRNRFWMDRGFGPYPADESVMPGEWVSPDPYGPNE